jgi:hypothetical protein
MSNDRSSLARALRMYVREQATDAGGHLSHIRRLEDRRGRSGRLAHCEPASDKLLPPQERIVKNERAVRLIRGDDLHNVARQNLRTVTTPRLGVWMCMRLIALLNRLDHLLEPCSQEQAPVDGDRSLPEDSGQNSRMRAYVS